MLERERSSLDNSNAWRKEGRLSFYLCSMTPRPAVRPLLIPSLESCWTPPAQKAERFIIKSGNTGDCTAHSGRPTSEACSDELRTSEEKAKSVVGSQTRVKSSFERPDRGLLPVDYGLGYILQQCRVWGIIPGARRWANTVLECRRVVGCGCGCGCGRRFLPCSAPPCQRDRPLGGAHPTPRFSRPGRVDRRRLERQLRPTARCFGGPLRVHMTCCTFRPDSGLENNRTDMVRMHHLSGVVPGRPDPPFSQQDGTSVVAQVGYFCPKPTLRLHLLQIASMPEHANPASKDWN